MTTTDDTAHTRATQSGGSCNSKMGKSDVGVLVVHGMGNQEPGATLQSFGVPFVEWISRRLGHLSGALAAERRDMSASWLKSGDVEVAAGHRPDAATPHHYSVKATWREKQGQNEQLTAVVAEAHWANSFPPPTFAELFNWSLRSVPEAMAVAVRTTPQPLARSLVALACPFLFILLLLLAGAAVLPFGSVRKGVQSVQTAISGSLGDAYQLTANPLTRADIVGKVVRDINWLMTKVDRVVVVAHSQGAAVSALALASPDLRTRQNVSALVTMGSGITKLARLEEARDRGHSIGRHFSALLLSGLAPVIVGGYVLFAWLKPSWFPSGASFWFALTIGLAIAVAASFTWMPQRQPQDTQEGVVRTGRIKHLGNEAHDRYLSGCHDDASSSNHHKCSNKDCDGRYDHNLHRH